MKDTQRHNISLTSLMVGITLAASVSMPAQALTQDITARFRPDPANPQINKFENTTPLSAICASHMAQRCKDLNIFSIEDRGFRASSIEAIQPGDDLRKAAMFKVPSEWRTVYVTHETTGEVEPVEFRIAGIGHGWQLARPPGVGAWGTSGQSWAERWTRPPAPCQSTGYLAAGTNFATFFWIVPEGAGACGVTAGTEIGWMNYVSVQYAYELRTPNPLTMSTGAYTGAIHYSMGPGQDFDFGDVMIPSDDLYTFNFILDVQHTLKVEIPPGGNRVELLPQGGWQAWLNQGRRPTRLFRDQTFNLSASSRFKMNLECQYASGNNCALWEPNVGHAVPLEVSVTLPAGLTDATGNPVNRRPLRRDGVGTELFEPRFYVERKPGTLHFEVARDEVEEMIKQNVSRSYSGNVTVIWDSQV